MRAALRTLAARWRASRAAHDAGFTLVEAMTALAVFSIAAIALVHAGAENLRAVGALQEKTLAGIVAENVLAERILDPAPLGLGVDAGEVELGGRAWTWERRVVETPDADLARLEVVVKLAGDPRPRAELAAFQRLGP